MEYLTIVVISLIVLFNIYVSVKISKCYTFNKNQKIIQTIIVWCIPIIAGLGSLYFIEEPMKHIKKTKNGFTEEGHCGASVHGEGEGD